MEGDEKFWPSWTNLISVGSWHSSSSAGHNFSDSGCRSSGFPAAEVAKWFRPRLEVRQTCETSVNAHIFFLVTGALSRIASSHYRMLLASRRSCRRWFLRCFDWLTRIHQHFFMTVWISWAKSKILQSNPAGLAWPLEKNPSSKFQDVTKFVPPQVWCYYASHVKNILMVWVRRNHIYLDSLILYLFFAKTLPFCDLMSCEKDNIGLRVSTLGAFKSRTCGEWRLTLAATFDQYLQYMLSRIWQHV